MCVNTVRRYYIYARESVKRRRRGQRTSPYTDGQSEKTRTTLPTQTPLLYKRTDNRQRTATAPTASNFRSNERNTVTAISDRRHRTRTDRAEKRKAFHPPDHCYYISGQTTDGTPPTALFFRSTVRRYYISGRTGRVLKYYSAGKEEKKKKDKKPTKRRN